MNPLPQQRRHAAIVESAERQKTRQRSHLAEPDALVASLQHRYWANWDPSSYAPEILRKDTRIYWSPQSCGAGGQCVGTFFGENPGSARSIHGLHFSGYSPLVDRSGNPGDPTLRLIYDAWVQAAKAGVVAPTGSDYIEVLNLYYFRNAKSGAAAQAWNGHGGPSIYSPSPFPTSRFVLLGWGKKPNRTGLAATAIGLIGQHPKILIPDSKAALTVTCGPLSSPPNPFPATPSFFNAGPRIRRPHYVANVAMGF